MEKVFFTCVRGQGRALQTSFPGENVKTSALKLGCSSVFGRLKLDRISRRGEV